MNKSGDKRGTKEVNPNNFANDPEKASAAGKKRKDNSQIIKSAQQQLTTGRERRITPEVQSEIRNALFEPDKNGVPFYKQFIQSFLNEAKKEPSGRAGMTLASTMFKENVLSVLDAEMEKQMNKDYEFTEYRIRKTLYPKQQEVYDDNLSRTIECICTRRAGKSELVARMLVREATRPPFMTPAGKALERNAIYLNRTFDNAVGQMGKPVTELLDNLAIKYEGSPGSGMIKLDNGNTITFGGYNNKGDIDKYRGFHYGLICLDEIGHLRNPDALMKETLEPALVDYGTEGKIIMTGTPPRVKANFAYIQWHNPNITHYHWSFMDNPFIPNKDAVIETACKEHGVTSDAPFIQREYYGNLEAFDVDALIFNGYKKVKEAPKGRTWSHSYIGVDWGYEDKAAVVSMVADRATKTMYVVDCWSMPKQAISTICEEICRQLNNLKTNFRLARDPWVICDSNEKGAVYELYKTYKIANAYCAYKYDRDMALDQLAEWCRTDRIFTYENAKPLIEDLDNSIWARDENTDQLLHELSDEYHPNAAMALLYASRQFAYDVMGIDAAKTAKDILEGRDD